MADVSVVIPTRNRLSRLKGAVGSVLAQEAVTVELIVVDDGSTDGTEAFLHELVSRDRRVRSIRDAESRGAAVARNRGADLATARFLAFNDDDCRWEPEKLRLQLERIRSSGAGVAYCREAVHWPGVGTVVNGSRGAERRGAVRSLVTANYIGTVGPVMERRLFQEVGGFDERLPRLQEWDLWLRLGLVTRFAFESRILVRGEAVTGGISQSSDALRHAARLMLAKWREEPRMSRRDLALLHYGIGKYLLSDGHVPLAREIFREGLRVDPGSPLNWVGVLGSVLRPWQFNLLKRARIIARRIVS